MYIYSPYWGTWSRLLLSSTARGFREYLELNLTPINPSLSDGWQRIPDMILRLHSTAIKPEDMRHHLPDHVRELMRRKLGYPLTYRLLHTNILEQVDLDKVYSRMRGGGIPLSNVKKEAA
jgi:hypothetical protein